MPTAPQPLAQVTPSGTGIVFTFADQDGADSLVTNVVSNNEEQSVTIAGNPSGGAFTLSFNGQTTAPIPTYPAPPAGFFQWNRTGLAAGSYDLAANIFQGGSASPNVLYEVFDGTTLLGTTYLNHAGDGGAFGGVVNPTPFQDGSLRREYPTSPYASPGPPIDWYPLGRFTVSGTLSVRVSCAPGDRQRLDADNLRIQAVSGGAVTLVQPAAPPATYADPLGTAEASLTGFQVDGDTANAFQMSGLGAGVRYLVDPAVAQAALQALSTVGAGNMTVTGDGSYLNRLRVKAAGALGGRPLSLIVATDPAVTVARVATGGVLPSIRVNGGSPIPLTRAMLHYYETPNPQMPTVVFLPTQARPAAEYSINFQYDNTLSNGSDGNWQPAYLAGYADPGRLPQVRATAGSTPTSTWQNWPVAAGQYRISATWPHDAGYSSSVTYTVKNRAGTTLGTHAVNQTIAPSGATDRGVPWETLGTFTLTGDDDGFAVVQSNGTSTTMVADALRYERLSADESLRFGPDDEVTISWGAGWATCQAGAVPAATDLPVLNLAGGTLCPPPPTSSRMKIGWNLAGQPQSIGVYLYNDLMAASDVAAPPTDLGTSYHAILHLNNTPIVHAGDRMAWANVPTGGHVLTWRGPQDVRVGAFGGTVTERTGEAVLADGGRKLRYYDFGGDAYHWGPEIYVEILGSDDGDGTYSAAVTDLHLYPEGTDLDDPPTFRADFLAKEAPMQLGRNLDDLSAIEGNATDFADYLGDTSRVTRNAPIRSLYVPIAKVEQHAGEGYDFDGSRGVVFKVTTTTPHGFADLQKVYFENYGGPAIELANDLGHASTWWPGGEGSACYVLSPTEFVWYWDALFAEHTGAGTEGDPYVYYPWRMTNVITDPAGGMRMTVYNAMPLAEIVERHNLNGLDLYFNTTFSCTDACLASLGTYLAEHLAPGLKLRVETSNETWNFLFPGRTANAMSFAFYGGGRQDSHTYTCEASHHQWTIMRAAWIAAGRDAADFVRVLGSQHTNPGVTDARAGYMEAHGYDFDELAIAPYFQNAPGPSRGPAPQAQFAAVIDRMTAAQHIDMYEIHRVWGGYESDFASHLGVLESKGFPGVKVIAYEGYWEHMVVPGGTRPRYGALSRAIHRNPRLYPLGLHALRTCEESGCTAFHAFFLGGVDTADQEMWSAYNGTAQPPYVPGDPTQDAIQVDTPERLDLVHSVAGGTVNAWAALVGATPSALAAGTATGGAVTATTAAVTATNCTGGTTPYTYQWYKSTAPGQLGAAVSGQTTRTLAATGLSPSTTYYFTLRYADAASGTVDSNQVARTTSAVGSMVAGTATGGAVTTSTAAVTATDASGGTAPFTYQWYRSTVSGQLGSALSGRTSRSLVDTGLTPSTTYLYTLRYTDNVGAHVDSNQVARTTQAATPQDSGPAPTTRAFGRGRFVPMRRMAR